MAISHRPWFSMFSGRNVLRAITFLVFFGVIIIGIATTPNNAQAVVQKESSPTPNEDGPNPNGGPSGPIGPIYYQLTVVPPSGGQIVSMNYSGINCPGLCTASYLSGTTVNLSVFPWSGWAFKNWLYNCTGSGPCSVTMNSNRTVGANIVPNTLSVTKSGNGIVVSTPGGINCGATCNAQFTQGSTVQLSATPDSGWVFTGWSGAGCSGTGTCTVTMSAPNTVNATFLPLYDLTITFTGPGSVYSIPASVLCSSDCTTTLVSGTTITLYAPPDQGYLFAGWSGICTGIAPCVVMMDQAKSLGATFIPKLQGTTHGPGTFTINDPGTSCGTNCSAYSFGTVVTLTAAPDAGMNFWGWTGACSSAGTGDCTLTMDGPKLVGAWFGEGVPHQTLTVNMSAGGGNGTGRVTSNPPGIDCTNDAFNGTSGCTGMFTPGINVTLTAASTHPDWYFNEWQAGCFTTDFTCTLTMNTDWTAYALFSVIPQSKVYVTLPIVGGTETGRVISNPPGIDCRNNGSNPTGCEAWFKAFDQNRNDIIVTLFPQPAAGYFFTGWSGGDCSVFGKNPCQFYMYGPRFVNVIGQGFEKQATLVLNVHKDPNWPGGSVYADDPGLTCTAENTCTWPYNVVGLKTVTLTAQPNPGMQWRWRIYCEPAGHESTCSFDIGNGLTQTVDIYFFPMLTLHVTEENGTGLGFMGISPVGDPPTTTTCMPSGYCFVRYPSTTTVTLTSNTNGSADFYWGDRCAGAVGSTCTFTISPGEWFGDGAETASLRLVNNTGAMKKTQTNTSTTNTNTTTNRNTNSGPIE